MCTVWYDETSLLLSPGKAEMDQSSPAKAGREVTAQWVVAVVAAVRLYFDTFDIHTNRKSIWARATLARACKLNFPLIPLTCLSNSQNALDANVLLARITIRSDTGWMFICQYGLIPTKKAHSHGRLVNNIHNSHWKVCLRLIPKYSISGNNTFFPQHKTV